MPISRFLGVLPVTSPDRALPFGGRVQILGIERYDARVAVTWRLAPLPDPVKQNELAMADLDQKTRDRSEDERLVLRRELAHRLVSPGADVMLSDDIGTTYQFCGGGSSGGGQEKIGRSDFIPAIPESATALTVHWGDLEFQVPLT
jgi:hypothetical protein